MTTPQPIRNREKITQSALLSLSISLFICTLAQAQFTNESDLLGITTSVATGYNGSGLSIYDFNQDGWDDMTIARGGEDIVFLINNQGVLTPAEFSIPNAGGELINMVIWADYDGDGDLDLLTTKQGGPVELWQNDGDFNFTEVSQEAGLIGGSYIHTGASWCDFDHDGDLDLYIAKFYHPNLFTAPQYTGVLYQNNGDGTFTDITVASGVYVNPRPIFQPIFLDYDNDGLEDLYLITDRVFVENALFKNNGDGTFTNVTIASGAGITICSMTGTVGDYDNDGDLDIYVTNGPTIGSKFLNNNGDGTFTEMAAAFGITATGASGWGSAWIDYDNDSFQDLFVGRTHGIASAFQGNRFFKNNGGTSFTESALSVGLLDELTQTYVCAMGDLNQDGYNDLLLNNNNGFLPQLYMNDGGDNAYLSVSLRGLIANMEGIGSWIKCYANGQETVRFSLCGENLVGQNPNRYIFGLADAQHVDSLVVQWNSGTKDVFYDLNVNQHIKVTEGMSPYYNGFVNAVYDYPPLCPGQSLELTFNSLDTLFWSTGELGSSISVTDPGSYFATLVTPWGDSIQSAPIQIYAAPEFSFNVEFDHQTCAGVEDGSIVIEFLDEFLPESVSWSHGSNEPELFGLAPNEYTYLIIDQSGCSYEGTVEILEASPMMPLVFASDVLCHGDSTGSAEVFVFGGSPPYQFDWNGQLPGALPAGEISLTIVDNENCETSIDFVINEPAPLEVDLQVEHITDENGGSANLEISGGTPPYSIQWDSGENSESATWNLDAGMYSVTISDAHSCSTYIEFEIYNLLDIPWWERAIQFLFPNPASTHIYVVNHGNMYFEYHIYDINGRVCKYEKQHPVHEAISVESLPSGNYLIVLTTDNYGNKPLRFTKIP